MASKERTLALSVLATFCGLIPTVYAASVSNSIVLVSDLLRCIVEFGAILLSWLIIRRVSRGDSTYYDFGFGKLEQAASLAVAAALLVSFLVTGFLAVQRLSHPEPVVNGLFGLLLAFASVVANALFWSSNRSQARRDASPILDSQWRLFRAKTFAAAVVAATLLLSMGTHGSSEIPWYSRYADAIGSMIMAIFFLFSAVRIIYSSMHDLVDRSIEEALRLIILKTLVQHEAEYTDLAWIRSRRAGSQIFIDLSLGFPGDREFAVVHDSMVKLQSEIARVVPGSVIQIIAYEAGNEPGRMSRALGQ